MSIYHPHRGRLQPERRRLLLDLAMGSAALMFSGCSPRSKAQAQEVEPSEADIQALIVEIQMERIATAAYAALSPLLSEELRSVGLLFGEHHQAHVEEGIFQLRGLGRPIPEPLPLPEFPEPQGDQEVLNVALGMERQAVESYLGLISQFNIPELRLSAAEILGSEVAHALALEAALAGVGPLDELATVIDFSLTSELLKR